MIGVFLCNLIQKNVFLNIDSFIRYNHRLCNDFGLTVDGFKHDSFPKSDLCFH
jgi:hypothetical protein